MALNDGCVAEMRTGEGKTLSPPRRASWTRCRATPSTSSPSTITWRSAHAEWVGRIYGLLGMKVGLVQNGMGPEERRPSYAASVTYGTNSEFGFDYLRDNMASSPRDRVQRGHAFAVVDEADSVLIDEARTPLIISGLSGAPSEVCGHRAPRVRAPRPAREVQGGGLPGVLAAGGLHLRGQPARRPAPAPCGARALPLAGSPERTTPSAPRAWCTPTPGRPPGPRRSTRPTPQGGEPARVVASAQLRSP